MAAIMEQCSGTMAVKKIAKRRICYITNNVNSYARILNGPKQLEQIGQFNELVASIATLRQEKEELEQGVKEEKRLLLAAKTERKEEREIATFISNKLRKDLVVRQTWIWGWSMFYR
jgi:hypothetical protein